MSTIYRAAIHCDAQRSVHCHGLFTVALDHVLRHRLAEQAALVSQEKGWRRSYGNDATVTRDVCPACQEPGA